MKCFKSIDLEACLLCALGRGEEIFLNSFPESFWEQVNMIITWSELVHHFFLQGSQGVRGPGSAFVRTRQLL